MSLPRRAGIGLTQRAGTSYWDVSFGSGETDVVAGNMLPGPYVIDTTGATNGDGLVFSSGSNKFIVQPGGAGDFVSASLGGTFTGSVVFSSGLYTTAIDSATSLALTAATFGGFSSGTTLDVLAGTSLTLDGGTEASLTTIGTLLVSTQNGPLTLNSNFAAALTSGTTLGITAGTTLAVASSQAMSFISTTSMQISAQTDMDITTPGDFYMLSGTFDLDSGTTMRFDAGTTLDLTAVGVLTLDGDSIVLDTSAGVIFKNNGTTRATFTHLGCLSIGTTSTVANPGIVLESGRAVNTVNSIAGVSAMLYASSDTTIIAALRTGGAVHAYGNTGGFLIKDASINTTFSVVPDTGMTHVTNSATTNATVDAQTFTLNSTGTVANSFGFGTLIKMEDSGGTDENAMRTSVIWSNATTENSVYTIQLRRAGAALAEMYRFGGDGGLVVGSTTLLGGVGMGLANNAGIWALTSGAAWSRIAILDGSNNTIIGSSSTAQLYSQALIVTFDGYGASGYVRFQTNSVDKMKLFTSGGLSLGTTAFSTDPGAGCFKLDEHIEFREISEPAAPSANGARLFVKDTGGGKSQLLVRFASGASQVIATEP